MEGFDPREFRELDRTPPALEQLSHFFLGRENFRLNPLASPADGISMNSEKTSKWKMAQATLETVRKHSTLWEGVPAYATAVTTLEETVTSITAAARTQTARSGDAAAKGAALQTMVNAAFTVCSALKALASATADRKLSTEVSFSRTNLARGRETEVVNRCQTMLNLGAENAELLAAKYNVSANDLKAVKTAIAAFGELQPKPRQSKATSAAATRDLETLFATLDEVLNNQIDPLTEKFRDSDATFYNEYKTSRSIVTNATSRETKPTVAPVGVPKAA